MLKQINKIYFLFATFCYALIGILFPVDLKALYLVNYLTVLVFALVLHNLQAKTDEYYTTRRLSVMVFCYSAAYVCCYNLISWFYTGNLYVFSVFDAMVYNEEAGIMANMPLMSGLEYYLGRHEAEDVGMALVLTLLYKVIASKVMLSILYTFLSVITARAMFAIARRFMSLKYAFLCAVTYSFSSYVLWFHSSGLKESMLVMLIIVFYSQYYRLISDRKMPALIWMLIISGAILLFRPVLVVFCFVSIGLGTILKRKLNGAQLLFIVAAILAGIFFLETIMVSTDKFLLGGTESMLQNKEMSGMVKGSVAFTYLVNVLSSLFGPFPTLASTKAYLSIFAPGLLLKLFVSLAFWFGCIHLVRIRLIKAYPLLIFVLLEMISLTYILEALELRKSIPHFPLVYIIAFIYIYKSDHNQLLTVKNHLFYRKSFRVLGVVVCMLTLYWNFR